MIVLFPTYARRLADGRWRARVEGMVTRPLPEHSRRRTLAVAVLRRLLDLDDGQLESEVFRRRAEALLFQRVAGRQVAVHVAGRTVAAAQTDRSGHFRAEVDLDAAAAGPRGGGLGIECTAAAEDGDEPPVGGPATGSIELVTDVGTSVISDIDDTVKITNVADRRELLRNTLLREFVAVPGMPEVFRGWRDAGTAFHYVSASPWQLSPCLCGFLAAAGLPAGSMHLKLFRLKDSTPLRRLPSRKRSKRRVIEQIMADFPGRRFLLVGDSGERDPEIYAAVARRRPAQVAGVAIRLVEARAAPWKVRERLATLSRKLPGGGITVFEAPEELAARHGLSNAF
ncbi:MAG: phosphatidate phosphatase App1 family protein [Planctomycetaceae bacterium]